MLSDVYENADDFDVIHSHIDYWSFAFARMSKTPTVSTVHGRLGLAALTPIYSRYKTVPLVSISDGQRTPATALEESGIGLAVRVCADFFNARPAHLRHGDCALHVTALVPGEMHLDALASNRKHRGFAFAHQ
jgi:hypothetical protein